MTITRVQAETILVKRTSELLTAAGMETEATGANADLNDALGYAVRKLGYTVTNVISVSNTDLALVATTEVDEFLDLAELRLLTSLAQRLDDVNITVGPRSEQYHQLVEQVERAIERKRTYMAQEYGLGRGQLETGTLEIEFMEENDADDV